MNVLFVFHDSNLYSGATHSLIDLITAWHRNNTINIQVLMPAEGSASEYLKGLGIKVHSSKYFSIRKSIKSKNKLFDYSKGLIKDYLSRWYGRQFVKSIEQEKIDYVYSNTGSIYFGYYLAKKLGAKHIWHIREFGPADQERVSYDNEKGFAKKLNQANRIIAISKSIKNYLIGIGVKEKLISMVYNDIDYEGTLSSDTVFPKEKCCSVLSCGGIQRNKGHLDVIKAIELVSHDVYDIRLYIAGNTNTEYYNELMCYVNEHHLENQVVFCGFLENLAALRQQCDIAIVASYSEAFGRVTVEGMLDRLLVIGANAAGTAELITHNETGLLFKVADVEELHDCIVFVLQNPDKAKSMIDKAHEFASRFNSGKAATTIMNFF